MKRTTKEKDDVMLKRKAVLLVCTVLGFLATSIVFADTYYSYGENVSDQQFSLFTNRLYWCHENKSRAFDTDGELDPGSDYVQKTTYLKTPELRSGNHVFKGRSLTVDSTYFYQYTSSGKDSADPSSVTFANEGLFMSTGTYRLHGSGTHQYRIRGRITSICSNPKKCRP